MNAIEIAGFVLLQRIIIITIASQSLFIPFVRRFI